MAAAVGPAEAGSEDLVMVADVGMTGPRRHLTFGSAPDDVDHSLACSLLLVRTT